MRFIITTHTQLDGVFLSCPGQWGNLPFVDADAAIAHARDCAAGKPVQVERERGKARTIPR